MLVVTVVNLVSVPLFLRYFGPEMYALWFYVITFTGMFGFADLGLGVAVGRYVGVALGKGDHAAVREYWATGNAIAIPLIAVMSAAFVILGVVFGPVWFNKIQPENIGLLRACFITGGFGLFFSYYAQFWNILSQAHLDFRYVSVLRGIVVLIQVIPSLVIARLTGSPLWINLWAVAVGVLQLIFLMLHARKKYGLGLNLRAATLARTREMAAYTVKTLMNLVAGSFFANIDRVIVGRLASSAPFTHYNICSNVGQRLQGVGNSAMGPVFYNTNRSVQEGATKAGRIYDEMFVFLFGWYCLAVMWSAVWHPVLLRLWLGAEVGGVPEPLLTPLVAAYCVAAMSGISGSQLASLNRLGAAMGFSVAAGVLAAAGAWLGWHWGGIAGAAWGFLASRLVFVVQDIFTMRLVGAKGWANPGVWREGAVQAVVALVFAASYWLLPRDSFWLVLPAILHGSLVSAWLLRGPLRRVLGESRVAASAPAPSSTSKS